VRVTFGGVWRTSAMTFAAETGPLAVVDFEHRGDGVTPVTAATPLPRDEYLACCGVQLDPIGAATSIIWAGNAVGGFEARATCAAGPCTNSAGIRVTFVPPVAAAGAD